MKTTSTIYTLLLAFAPCACGQPEVPSETGFDSETGSPIDHEPGLLEPGECLTDKQEDVFGYKYQCEGSFFAHIGGVYDDEPFSFFVPQMKLTNFGPGHDPYEIPKVMACCGEYDDEMTFEEQPHFAENCMMDFRQQACLSLALGLKKLIDDGTVPLLYRGKAVDVQKYLAQNWGACVQNLVDIQDAPDLLSARWDLPTEGPWNPIEDVFVEIDIATLDGVYAPEGPATCESLHVNNHTFFGEESASPDSSDLDLEWGEGRLNGPTYGPLPVSGRGPLASLASSCTDPFCSTLRISDDASDGSWTLEEMVLFVDGEFVVTDGQLSQTLTDVRLELYGPAAGKVTQGASGGLSHLIPAGGAHFVVAGKTDGQAVTIPVINSSPLLANKASASWSFAPFSIDYLDEMGGRWKLELSAMDWR